MNQTKLLFPLIFISLEDDSSIVIPPQPTDPGEIMSGGEGEPVEADVPAEDETVSPQGMHVTGTQTVTHEYLTLNGKVARETIKTNNSLTAVLDFIYDESGKPFALKYSTNGTSFQTYYYVLNLQGDVVKLIHYIPGFEYESVATYEYDAWSNVSSSGRLAEINPLRYRGYYYDNETGFYYLQSRYYDPANRRFISADVYASTGQGFVGTNMFAYCNNKPIINSDPSGHALRSNLTAICDGGSGYLDRTKDVKRVLRENYEQAKRWGLTPVEVATLASIVEEETNKRDEMGKVAGLYMNRLRKGMPLQADPTVKFAHGDFSLKRILNVHLTIESPYNTYRVTGLPPGPIRIPSKQVIDAVLTHTPNGYFYMCAKEDFSGYHNFAVTLAEHQRNAIRYQQALNRLGIR